MTNIKGAGINEAWVNLMSLLHSEGNIINPRGMVSKELLNVSVEITDPRKRIITIPTRKISLPFAFGEFLWYLNGRNDVSMMEYYSRRMRTFSDDGKTLNSAYGYRIFGKHPMLPFDQWENAVRLLVEDPDTRQAIIHLHTPNDKPTKDEVCTLSLQFLIRNNKLDMVVNMRSNDAVWGFTYDVFNFTTFQELMANQLGIDVGTYYHNAASMHIYERDYETAEKIHNLKDNLAVMYPYEKQFPYDGLTIYSEDWHNLTFNEAILRSSHEALINPNKFDDILLGVENKSLRDMLEVFRMYAIYKLGKAKGGETEKDAKEILLGMLKYDKSFHCIMRNYMFAVPEKDRKGMIILEGPDGAGKSTIAQQIINYDSSYHIVDFGRPTKYFDKEIYMLTALSSANIVLDRFFYSELVYSKVFGRDPILTRKEGQALEGMLMKNKAGLAYVDTDPATCYSRLDADDAALFTSKDINNLSKEYDIMFEESQLSEYGYKFRTSEKGIRTRTE